MVKIDESGLSFQTTDLGRLMARYYLKFPTAASLTSIDPASSVL